MQIAHLLNAQALNTERQAYIERLKENQPEQELEIRRRLKLVKPNEKIFMKRSN